MSVEFPSESEMKARAARQRVRDAQQRLKGLEADERATLERIERNGVHLAQMLAAQRQAWANLLWRQWIEAGTV